MRVRGICAHCRACATQVVIVLVHVASLKPRSAPNVTSRRISLNRAINEKKVEIGFARLKIGLNVMASDILADARLARMVGTHWPGCSRSAQLHGRPISRAIARN